MSDTNDNILKMKFDDMWDNNANSFNKLIADYIKDKDDNPKKYTHIHTKLFSEKDVNKTSVLNLTKLINGLDIDWNKAEMPNSRNAGLFDGDLNTEKLLSIVDALIERVFPAS